MSIRLRLTLLYSAIVALTVLAFSVALYTAQSQFTLDMIRDSLGRQTETVANTGRRPPFPGAVPTRPEGTPERFNLPGRWMQLRTPDGTVMGRTPDLADAPLPLSDQGFKIVSAGGTWTEVATVQLEPVLIYSRPLGAQGRVNGIVQLAAPLTEREQSLANLRLFLAVGTGLVSLTAFAIGWVLSGTAISPIHRITRTAQAIGAERDLSRRVQHTGPSDEVGQLATTFNVMLGELESAQRQLQQSLDVQRRFVADASHELRTPLTTVSGNIELLRREPPLPADDRASVLADTKEEVERLIRLVHQLLTLARLDSGRPLAPAPMPLQPLLDDVCRQARLLGPGRPLGCDATAAHVVADADALKQVLLILLDNAIAHTPPDASIGLRVSVDDGRVTLRVSDTGAGIAPDVLPHLFERFYRGDAARSGNGTGLGLAIGKELIEAQGGTITVESVHGKGTTFVVTLPQAATA